MDPRSTYDNYFGETTIFNDSTNHVKITDRDFYSVAKECLMPNNTAYEMRIWKKESEDKFRERIVLSTDESHIPLEVLSTFNNAKHFKEGYEPEETQEINVDHNPLEDKDEKETNFRIQEPMDLDVDINEYSLNPQEGFFNDDYSIIHDRFFETEIEEVDNFQLALSPEIQIENFEPEIEKEDDQKLEVEVILSEQELVRPDQEVDMASQNYSLDFLDENYIIQNVYKFEIIRKPRLDSNSNKNEYQSITVFTRPISENSSAKKNDVFQCKKNKIKQAAKEKIKKPKKEVLLTSDVATFTRLGNNSKLMSEMLSFVDSLSRTYYSSKNQIKMRDLDRKYKPDDIRKKIKVNFHKNLRKRINLKIKKAGSRKIFDSFNQNFITNITRGFNYDILDLTLEELFKMEFKGDNDKDEKMIRNVDTLNYLHRNEEIEAKSNFKNIKNLTYSQLFYDYLHSKEYLDSLNKVREGDEIYFLRYYEVSQKYIEFFCEA